MVRGICNDPLKESERRKKLSLSLSGKNNPMFGKRHTQEELEKMSASHKGKSCSDRAKTLLSEQRMGERNPFFGKTHSPESRARMGESNNQHFAGHHHTQESRNKISKAQIGRCVTEQTRNKISKKNIGKHLSQETRIKLSNVRKGKRCGKDNPNWRGGTSYEPYCPKFTKEFKERVRAFFGYCCAECGNPQNGIPLAVHHVNFDKSTCCNESIPLFVPLCPSCHGKTNTNRAFWRFWFTEMISRTYGERCYFTKEEWGELKHDIPASQMVLSPPSLMLHQHRSTTPP